VREAHDVSRGRSHACIESEKRDGKTMGEALGRTVGGYDLLDFADDAAGGSSLDLDRIESAMATASERNAPDACEHLDIH
jgi:hypothetical protein